MGAADRRRLVRSRSVPSINIHRLRLGSARLGRDSKGPSGLDANQPQQKRKSSDVFVFLDVKDWRRWRSTEEEEGGVRGEGVGGRRREERDQKKEEGG